MQKSSCVLNIFYRSSRVLAPLGLIMCACLAAGCSNLPKVDSPVGATLTPRAVPTAQAVQAAQVAPPVQLEGANGLLSPQQTKAVLKKISRRAPETNIFEWHLALEESIAPTRLVVGNRVVLLQDGPATYKAMQQVIKQAKDHINMETYIIEDDEIGRDFSKLLIEKQQAGVQVNLIYDSVGSVNTPRAFFDHLKENGINVLEFNPVNPLLAKKGWQINQRDHRKLLIVDGHTAILGGVNISAVYSGGSAGHRAAPKLDAQKTDAPKVPWRDTDMQISGPVVANFQKLFMETWAKQQGATLAEKKYFPIIDHQGGEVIRAIGSSSDDALPQMYTTLISAINNAETAVSMTIAYFVPDPQLLDALKAAVKRGAEVKVILPSQTDSSLVFHAGRSYYTGLLKNGIKIYERREKLLHSKTVLIDGVWSTVGSTNLDWRSFLHNDELNAVVLGTDFGAQMNAMFNQDLAGSDEITLEQWRQRGLVERLKETAARVWAYWL